MGREHALLHEYMYDVVSGPRLCSQPITWQAMQAARRLIELEYGLDQSRP